MSEKPCEVDEQCVTCALLWVGGSFGEMRKQKIKKMCVG